MEARGMFTRLFEEAVKAIILIYIIAAIATVIVAFVAGLIVFVITLCAILCITLFVYPYIHNAGLSITDRLRSRFNLPDTALATILVWVAMFCGYDTLSLLVLAGFGVDLPSAPLADVSLSALVGLSFGAGITLWDQELDTPGPGPIRTLLEAIGYI
jgi:lysylphosphatidylglycerol synthetase-like protein (DUF2156 family)